MHLCKDCKHIKPNESYLSEANALRYAKCKLTAVPYNNSIYEPICPQTDDPDDVKYDYCFEMRSWGFCRGYAWFFEAKDSKRPRTFKEKMSDVFKYYKEKIHKFIGSI